MTFVFSATKRHRFKAHVFRHKLIFQKARTTPALQFSLPFPSYIHHFPRSGNPSQEAWTYTSGIHLQRYRYSVQIIVNNVTHASGIDTSAGKKDIKVIFKTRPKQLPIQSYTRPIPLSAFYIRLSDKENKWQVASFSSFRSFFSKKHCNFADPSHPTPAGKKPIEFRTNAKGTVLF